MRAPRCVLFGTAFATVGAAALLLGLPNTASADDNRYTLFARGDAFYFEVNGDEIPASPKNDAGSLTAAANTSNTGGSDGFAGMPYWGNTVQYAPGTVNGIPNQFGVGQVQIPFAVLPGFVTSSSSGVPEAEDDFGYGRVRSASTPDAAVSSAQYGAPPSVPAPNQQQSANASTESKGDAVSALASGSSSGFVAGPLEVGNSTALAAISQNVGADATIEGRTFGRFSVNGQEFGFDQDGFRYLGQAMSSEDAVGQANTVLTAAGIQIDLAPVLTDRDASGITTHTIGGLMVTTTLPSPTGAGTFTVKYILGRATVGAAIADLGSPTVGTSTADAELGESGLVAASSPALVGAVGPLPSMSSAPGASDVAAPLVEEVPVAGAAVRTLGFAVKAGQTGDGTEDLYAMLILAGAGVVGGHFLFSRFAVARKGA